MHGRPTTKPKHYLRKETSQIRKGTHQEGSTSRELVDRRVRKVCRAVFGF